jgi:hypothetical protein
LISPTTRKTPGDLFHVELEKATVDQNVDGNPDPHFHNMRKTTNQLTRATTTQLFQKQRALPIPNEKQDVKTESSSYKEIKESPPLSRRFTSITLEKKIGNTQLQYSLLLLFKNRIKNIMLIFTCIHSVKKDTT